MKDALCREASAALRHARSRGAVDAVASVRTADAAGRRAPSGRQAANELGSQAKESSLKPELARRAKCCGAA